ncbi:transmembrane protein 253 isoform X3 [Ambystoma mexicanum]|uniref:transmembrane protein 253 isoform X3 n=1 Tax=Ambystoma mexicanum TaxID=8296 RepID=UPI0037E939A1
MAVEQEDQSPSEEASPEASERLKRQQRLVNWLRGPPRQRLQLLGMVQILTGLVSIPITVSFACLDFGCNVVLAMPLWSGILYLLTGFCALALLYGPRRAAKMRALMVLNLLALVVAGCAILLFSLQVAKEQRRFTPSQKHGMLVMKGTATGLTTISLLTSLLTLILLACRKPVSPLHILRRYQKLEEERVHFALNCS